MHFNSERTATQNASKHQLASISKASSIMSFLPRTRNLIRHSRVQKISQGIGLIMGYYIVFYGAWYLHQRFGESAHNVLKVTKTNHSTGQNGNKAQESLLGTMNKAAKKLLDIWRRGGGPPGSVPSRNLPFNITIPKCPNKPSDVPITTAFWFQPATCQHSNHFQEQSSWPDLQGMKLERDEDKAYPCLSSRFHSK